jgi:hypothetical protein
VGIEDGFDLGSGFGAVAGQTIRLNTQINIIGVKGSIYKKAKVN